MGFFGTRRKAFSSSESKIPQMGNRKSLISIFHQNHPASQTEIFHLHPDQDQGWWLFGAVHVTTSKVWMKHCKNPD